MNEQKRFANSTPYSLLFVGRTVAITYLPSSASSMTMRQVYAKSEQETILSDTIDKLEIALLLRVNRF